MFVNLIGALGPELSFDALWYHLTLPQLFLQHHMIYHIPGGLLYYSDMPKLAEMLYITGLSFGSEIIPKLMHFSFGILCCIALYQLSKRYLSSTHSMLAVLIFYTNLVVGWESITAYIDVIRTFFELLAIYAWILWYETKQQKWFYLSAIMIGFAIQTKLLAIGSLFIMLILTFIYFLKQKSNQSFIHWIIRLFTYSFISLLPSVPWFIFSYIHTGNPVYPFFTSLYTVTPSSFSLINIIRDLLMLFTHAADPISPLYIITLPLLFVSLKKYKPLFPLLLYSFLAIIFWYFTPRTGGGRFILPYIPIFSLMTSYCIEKAKELRIFLLIISILVICISIGYRSITNAKYIPVIIGKESQQQFLTRHLNFAYGDFYDTDNFFKNHIEPTNTVLLYGFHNLYYVNFPFIDASWYQPTDTFTYIATQKANLPTQYQSIWKLIYTNPQTFVKVYTKNQ